MTIEIFTDGACWGNGTPQALDAYGAERLFFHWVRGHAGHPENEKADALAQKYLNISPRRKR